MATYTWEVTRDQLPRVARLLALASRAGGVKLQELSERIKSQPGYPLAAKPEDTVNVTVRKPKPIVVLGERR